MRSFSTACHLPSLSKSCLVYCYFPVALWTHSTFFVQIRSCISLHTAFDFQARNPMNLASYKTLIAKYSPSQLTDLSVKVQLQTVPKKTSFHRSPIDRYPQTLWTYHKSSQTAYFCPTIELDAARHPSRTIRMLHRRVGNEARIELYSASWARR